jgi:hypothetical protein
MVGLSSLLVVIQMATFTFNRQINKFAILFVNMAGLTIKHGMYTDKGKICLDMLLKYIAAVFP